jgi:hypothetical protein
MSENIKNIKQMVEYILERYPDTRNDDPLLTFQIIYKFMPEETFFQEETGRWFMSTRALKKIREDEVKRVRAKIQNIEHRFLPTTEEIRKKRKISEADWFNYSLEK